MRNADSKSPELALICCGLEPFCVWADEDKMKLFFFASLTLFLLSIYGFAQGGHSVSGRLAESGRPFADQEIRLESGGGVIAGHTDTAGRYEFKNIPAGNYVLAYGTHRLNVFVTTSGVQFGSVDALVTVAAGLEQTVEQVSKTVNVIDGQQLRDRADFSLIESLRTIPGFRVQQSGGFGKVATIKTRGLRNQDTALLIDGIRFRDPTAITGDASPFLSDFTNTAVDRVEVLRGSGSSLYGTNAIGGVVDFRTPEARQGTHGQVAGAVGGLGLGRFRGLLSHGTESGKFGIVGAVSRTVYTKGVDGDDDAHNTNFQTRADIRPSKNTNVSGRIFFSDANVRLNSSPDTAGVPASSNFGIVDAVPGVNFAPDADDPDAIQHSRFFSGQIVVDQVVNSQLFLNGYYQGLKTRRRNDNGLLGPGFQDASTSIFDGQVHTANAHLVWTPTGKNTLTSGYEFELEKFGNQGATPSGSGNFFVDEQQSSHTFYIQDLASLADGRLQIAGGFRAQMFSLSTPTFSLTNAPYSRVVLSDPPTAYTFDGAASYYFRSSGTKLRAHAGNGYRVPSLYERFGTFYSSFGTPSFVALGDPFLKPERSIAFDAGIEQSALADKLRLSATYFYTKLVDVIGFGDVVSNIGTTPRPFGGYVNEKGGISRGAEFSANAKVSRTTDIFTSYTFTNSDQLAPQVSKSGVYKSLGIPDHQFTVVATQRFSRAWINFDFLATSTYLAPVFSNFNFTTYVYRFEGNRKGDLTGGYTFGLRNEKSLRVYATVENVFNQEYYENGFRTAKATARLGATFAF